MFLRMFRYFNVHKQSLDYICNVGRKPENTKKAYHFS